MDLLVLENVQPKFAGGAGARRLTGTVYATDLDVSGTVGALTLTQNSQAVLDAATTFGGDISGTYGSITVGKLQGRAVDSSAPSDGECLLWVAGNNRWEPGSPAGTVPASTQASSILIGNGSGGWVEEVDFEVNASGQVVDGTWTADIIGTLYGGTGQNSSASTGIPMVTAGAWSFGASLANLSDVYDSISGTDEYVVYYDGPNTRWDSKYPGVVNYPGTRTFTILDNTAVSTDINTALTNYDVVYLKTGTYTCGSTAISIPDGKALIGLTACGWTTTRTTLSFSGSPATAHVIAAGSRLERVEVALTGAAHTTDVVLSTGGNAVVTDVLVNASTAASIWGFNGEFSELSRISVINVNGIRYIGSDRGILRDFWINQAPTYGLFIYNGQAHISHGTIDCSATTTYGVYCSVTTPTEDIYLNGVVVNDPATTGFHFTGSSAVNTVTARFNGCCVYNAASGVADRGFYANYASWSTWTDCYAEYCNGTAAQAYGAFCVENSDNIGVSNCSGAYSTNTNNCDFWFNVVNYSSFTGLRSRGSYTGAHWYNGTCTGNAVSGVEVRDQTNAAGFPLYYNGTYSSIASVTASNPVGRILFVGSQNTVSAIQSYNGTNIGISLNSTYSSYSSIAAYSAGFYGITTNAPYSTFTGLTACGNASVGIYIDAAAAYSTFTGLVANSNTSYGVQLVNTANRLQISGVESYNNGSWGFYAGELYVSTIGNVNTHQNTANGGFFIGTNNFVTICNVNSYGNTGTGYSRGTSPTTANSSTSAIITSKTNTVAQYVTSGSWNTNGEY